jgi:phenylacetaldehyde dehydrogenase
MKALSELLPAARAFLAKPARMLIGGQWREAASGEALPSPDPVTGETQLE